MKWICRGCQNINKKFKPCKVEVEGEAGLATPINCPFAEGNDPRREYCQFEEIRSHVKRRKK